MPAMVDDPVNAININNIHRSSGVGDLWTLDEWAVNYGKMTDSDRYYKFPVPTLVPDMWLYGANKPPSQDDYNAEFTKLYPIVSEILPIHNVSVCGGAAARPLTSGASNNTHSRPTNWSGSDVDMFVHGIDASDEKALWATADTIMTRLRAQFTDADIRYGNETLVPGLITINARMPRSSIVRKYQIILRAFPSLTAILHGLDIPACCVSYDGITTRTTYLGAYAHVYQTNSVCPDYRSTTYEYRMEKYLKRGYAMAMPNFDAKFALPGGRCELPHMSLIVESCVSNLITGRIYIESTPMSDYDPTTAHDRSAYDRSSYAYRMRKYFEHWYPMAMPNYRTNVCKIARNCNALSRTICYTTYQSRVDMNATEAVSKLRCSSYHEILPLGTLMQSLDFAIMTGSIFGDARKVDRECLRNLLGMTDEEITEFELKIAELHGSQQSKRSNAAALLKKYSLRVVEAYNKLTATKLEWWILADTSSQRTVSLNPIMEDPVEWYGDTYHECVQLQGFDGQIMIALIGLSNLCNNCPMHIRL
jgi:hypothetical protein